MRNLLDPSFFVTKTIGEPHGLEDGAIIPLLSRSFVVYLPQLALLEQVGVAERCLCGFDVWSRLSCRYHHLRMRIQLCNLVMMLRRKFFNTGLVQILKKGWHPCSWFIVVLHTSFFSFKASQLNTGRMLPMDIFFFIVRYLSVGLNTLKGMKPGFVLSRSTTTLTITASALSTVLWLNNA